MFNTDFRNVNFKNIKKFVFSQLGSYENKFKMMFGVTELYDKNVKWNLVLHGLTLPQALSIENSEFCMKNSRKLLKFSNHVA
jgi:hypothetical protein